MKLLNRKNLNKCEYDKLQFNTVIIHIMWWYI